MSAFFELVKRDILLSIREGSTVGIALGFYLIVISVLPLGLGPDLNLLSRIAPGVLWVALLLSVLLSSDRIFLNDYEEGALEMIMLGPLPPALIAAAKSLAHWITIGIPLALMSPILGLLLNLEAQGFGPMVLTALVGTPALSFLSAIGAALTLGLKRGGLLLPVLILPLFIPVLIFGVGATTASLFVGGNFGANFALLSAMSLVTILLSPLAAGAALRFNMQ